MYLLLMTTLLFAAHGVFVSCDDNEDFTTSPSAKLTFPADTLRLDTALTVVSSPTYSFTVHNRTSKGIRITNVALANPESSGFRVNVDGTFINDDYDYIVIDTPPARDNLTISALFCADEVLIPVRCDNFSLEGFETTLAMILDLETREDVKIDILGVVLTQVERTAAVNLVRQMFEENPEYASVLFKTGIRKGSAVPESTIAAVPVVLYSKKSNPSVDYMQLWNEIKQRLAKKEADE